MKGSKNRSGIKELKAIKVFFPINKQEISIHCDNSEILAKNIVPDCCTFEAPYRHINKID